MGILDQEISPPTFDVEAFRARKLTTDGLPDLYLLTKPEEQALWCLWFSKDKMGFDYLSAAEITTILADVFEVSAKEPAVRMALTRASGKVHTKSFGRANKFSIMKAGKDELSASAANQVVIVDPTQPHTSIRKVADLFGSFASTSKICDPYLDHRTLEVTAMIPDSCQIQLLSTPAQNQIVFSRLYSAYRTQHGNLEVRTIPAGQLHDRYVLTGQDMWLIGHSLNRIGTKQTFIVRLVGDVKEQMEGWFDSTWRSAQAVK